jgi:transposase
MVQWNHMKKSHHHQSRALSQDELEKRRKQASRYFTTTSAIKIAEKYGVSRIAVYQWIDKWKKEGEKGLLQGTYGRISKMTVKQEESIKRDILKGAKKFGYDTDFWTLGRIATHIKKQIGIVYHDRSIAHTMTRFGFSCQKPVRRAKERNEKAIRTWVAHTWPAIKKRA